MDYNDIIRHINQLSKIYIKNVSDKSLINLIAKLIHLLLKTFNKNYHLL